jgi:hypothetical protein
MLGQAMKTLATPCWRIETRVMLAKSRTKGLMGLYPRDRVDTVFKFILSGAVSPKLSRELVLAGHTLGPEHRIMSQGQDAPNYPFEAFHPHTHLQATSQAISPSSRRVQHHFAGPRGGDTTLVSTSDKFVLDSRRISQNCFSQSISSERMEHSDQKPCISRSAATPMYAPSVVPTLNFSSPTAQSNQSPSIMSRIQSRLSTRSRFAPSPAVHSSGSNPARKSWAPSLTEEEGSHNQRPPPLGFASETQRVLSLPLSKSTDSSKENTPALSAVLNEFARVHDSQKNQIEQQVNLYIQIWPTLNDGYREDRSRFCVTKFIAFRRRKKSLKRKQVVRSMKRNVL